MMNDDEWAALLKKLGGLEEIAFDPAHAGVGEKIRRFFEVFVSEKFQKAAGAFGYPPDDYVLAHFANVIHYLAVAKNATLETVFPDADPLVHWFEGLRHEGIFKYEQARRLWAARLAVAAYFDAWTEDSSLFGWKIETIPDEELRHLLGFRIVDWKACTARVYSTVKAESGESKTWKDGHLCVFEAAVSFPEGVGQCWLAFRGTQPGDSTPWSLRSFVRSKSLSDDPKTMQATNGPQTDIGKSGNNPWGGERAPSAASCAPLQDRHLEMIGEVGTQKQEPPSYLVPLGLKSLHPLRECFGLARIFQSLKFKENRDEQVVAVLEWLRKWFPNHDGPSEEYFWRTLGGPLKSWPRMHGNLDWPFAVSGAGPDLSSYLDVLLPTGLGLSKIVDEFNLAYGCFRSTLKSNEQLADGTISSAWVIDPLKALAYHGCHVGGALIHEILAALNIPSTQFAHNLAPGVARFPEIGMQAHNGIRVGDRLLLHSDSGFSGSVQARRYLVDGKLIDVWLDAHKIEGKSRIDKYSKLWTTQPLVKQQEYVLYIHLVELESFSNEDWKQYWDAGDEKHLMSLWCTGGAVPALTQNMGWGDHFDCAPLREWHADFKAMGSLDTEPLGVLLKAVRGGIDYFLNVKNDLDLDPDSEDACALLLPDDDEDQNNDTGMPPLATVHETVLGLPWGRFPSGGYVLTEQDALAFPLQWLLPPSWASPFPPVAVLGRIIHGPKEYPKGQEVVTNIDELRKLYVATVPAAAGSPLLVSLRWPMGDAPAKMVELAGVPRAGDIQVLKAYGPLSLCVNSNFHPIYVTLGHLTIQNEPVFSKEPWILGVRTRDEAGNAEPCAIFWLSAYHDLMHEIAELTWPQRAQLLLTGELNDFCLKGDENEDSPRWHQVPSPPGPCAVCVKEWAWTGGIKCGSVVPPYSLLPGESPVRCLAHIIKSLMTQSENPGLTNAAQLVKLAGGYEEGKPCLYVAPHNAGMATKGEVNAWIAEWGCDFPEFDEKSSTPEAMRPSGIWVSVTHIKDFPYPSNQQEFETGASKRLLLVSAALKECADLYEDCFEDIVGQTASPAPFHFSDLPLKIKNEYSSCLPGQLEPACLDLAVDFLDWARKNAVLVLLTDKFTCVNQATCPPVTCSGTFVPWNDPSDLAPCLDLSYADLVGKSPLDILQMLLKHIMGNCPTNKNELAARVKGQKDGVSGMWVSPCYGHEAVQEDIDSYLSLWKCSESGAPDSVWSSGIWISATPKQTLSDSYPNQDSKVNSHEEFGKRPHRRLLLVGQEGASCVELYYKLMGLLSTKSDASTISSNQLFTFSTMLAELPSHIRATIMPKFPDKKFNGAANWAEWKDKWSEWVAQDSGWKEKSPCASKAMFPWEDLSALEEHELQTNPGDSPMTVLQSILLHIIDKFETNRAELLKIIDSFEDEEDADGNMKKVRRMWVSPHVDFEPDKEHPETKKNGFTEYHDLWKLEDAGWKHGLYICATSEQELKDEKGDSAQQDQFLKKVEDGNDLLSPPRHLLLVEGTPDGTDAASIFVRKYKEIMKTLGEGGAPEALFKFQFPEVVQSECGFASPAVMDGCKSFLDWKNAHSHKILERPDKTGQDEVTLQTNPFVPWIDLTGSELGAGTGYAPPWGPGLSPLAVQAEILKYFIKKHDTNGWELAKVVGGGEMLLSPHHSCKAKSDEVQHHFNAVWGMPGLPAGFIKEGLWICCSANGQINVGETYMGNTPPRRLLLAPTDYDSLMSDFRTISTFLKNGVESADPPVDAPHQVAKWHKCARFLVQAKYDGVKNRVDGALNFGEWHNEHAVWVEPPSGWKTKCTKAVWPWDDDASLESLEKVTEDRSVLRLMLDILEAILVNPEESNIVTLATEVLKGQQGTVHVSPAPFSVDFGQNLAGFVDSCQCGLDAYVGASGEQELSGSSGVWIRIADKAKADDYKALLKERRILIPSPSVPKAVKRLKAYRECMKALCDSLDNSAPKWDFKTLPPAFRGQYGEKVDECENWGAWIQKFSIKWFLDKPGPYAPSQDLWDSVVVEGPYGTFVWDSHGNDSILTGLTQLLLHIVKKCQTDRDTKLAGLKFIAPSQYDAQSNTVNVYASQTQESLLQPVTLKVSDGLQYLDKYKVFLQSLAEIENFELLDPKLKLKYAPECMIDGKFTWSEWAMANRKPIPTKT